MKKALLVFGLMFIGLNSGFVHAAQTAKIVVDNASVLDKPQADGMVIGTVPKDTSLAVSNVPTNGYYKARIPSGAIGWISGNDVLTVNPAGAMTANPSPTPVAAEPMPGATPIPAPKKAAEKKKNPNERIDHSRIQVTFGMNILNNTGFPTQIPVTGSTTGYGGTFEMQFKINEQFYWAGRAEYLFSSSSQTVSATVSQTFKFHTLPIMGGLIWVPMSTKEFRLGVGGYAGLSLATGLDITHTDGTTTGTVSYSSSDIAFMGNLQGSYAVSTGMSIVGEVGYRIHSASYPQSTDLPADAFKANFGGLVTRLGVEFRL